MYTNIVVGTDGSVSAQAAVKAAGEIARKFDVGKIHVVAGYRPISPAELNHVAHELPNEYRESLTPDMPGTSLVDDATTALRTMNVEVTGHPVANSGAEAILDVADDVGADLIVVGSRGNGVSKRLLRGSVSTKVAHHAPCNVMIVHDPELHESR